MMRYIQKYSLYALMISSILSVYILTKNKTIIWKHKTKQSTKTISDESSKSSSISNIKDHKRSKQANNTSSQIKNSAHSTKTIQNNNKSKVVDEDVYVVANVNGEAITNYHVDQYYKLLEWTKQISKNETEARKADIKNILLPKIMEFKIQAMHAAALGITVEQSEMEEYIHNLEKMQNIPYGNFANAIEKFGLSYDVVLEVLKSELMHGKLVRNIIARSIVVQDVEVLELVKARNLDTKDTEIVNTVREEIFMTRVESSAQKILDDAYKFYYAAPLNE